MALKIKAGVRCRTCGKTYANPFTHTCQVRTDFKARQRAAERQAVVEKRRARAAARRQAEAARRRAAAERRKARQKAAAAAKRAKAAERRRAAADKRRAAAAAKRPARPARPPHDYRTCTDPTCRRYACLAWKEAFQEGRTGGLEDGFEEGYTAGLARR
jgi:hypothetical protein